MINAQTNVTEFYGKDEAEQLESYIRTYYAIKVPAPVKPTKEDLSFWKIAGFETISFFIPSVAFAIFSAVRTSGFFFVQERTLLNNYNLPEEFVWLLSLLVMVMGILGFEGILLARGIKFGREQTENKESKMSTWLSASVIIGVGVYIGLNMLPIPDDIMLYIDVTMALLTGIAGGVITFFGGNDIGFAIKKYETEKVKIQKEYQDFYNDWYESAVSSYISAKKQVAKISGIASVQNVPEVSQKPDQPKKMSKVEQAYVFVSEYYNKNKQLPTNQIIADSTGVALGSAHSGLQRFIVDNDIELVSAGIVKQEHVEEIKRKLFGKPEDIINEFILKNGRFMDGTEVAQIGLTVREVAKYVDENEEMMKERNLLDGDSIAKAIAMNRGEEGN